MRRRTALSLVPLLLAGCGGTPTAAERPTATPRPTAAPSATPRPDYGALARRLVVVIGPLIVAVRERSATAPQRRAEWETASAPVLAAIEGDVSEPANRLHSAVVNVREAAARGDVATLERERLNLLDVR